MNAVAEFKPMSEKERNRMSNALKAAGDSKGIMLMGADTSFLDMAPPEDIINKAEVIDAVRSIPSHY